MARPTTKKELEELSRANYTKLFGLINSYTEEVQEKEFTTPTLNRNIRDVLAHLHYWHLLMLGWYEVGMKGEKPKMPAKGYTWKTSKELNKKIWEETQKITLKEAKEQIDTSYKKLQQLIQKHSDKELFEKKKYHWTGSTSLGAYLISATSSHYDWAYKLIKKGRK